MHNLQNNIQTQPVKTGQNSKRTNRADQTISMGNAPPTSFNELQEEMVLQPVVKVFSSKVARAVNLQLSTTKKK